jgi:hypothetical protein
MLNPLAREFQTHHPHFASLLDALLNAEKELYNYPSPEDWIVTHGFYPRDPAELTCDHLSRGHFTEAIEALAGIFGPCEISREACFRQIGVYPGQGPDLNELRAELSRLQERLQLSKKQGLRLPRQAMNSEQSFESFSVWWGRGTQVQRGKLAVAPPRWGVD